MTAPPAGTPPPAYGLPPTGGDSGLSLWEQIQGVLLFKADVYRAIAKDIDATLPAMIIVVAVALFAGILGVLSSFTTLWAVTQIASANSPELAAMIAQAGGPTALMGDPTSSVTSIASAPVGALVSWVVVSWLFNVFAKLYGGTTTPGEMLRVNGFATLFSAVGAIVGIVPCGGIIGVVLVLAANVVGVREAAFANNPDGTTKAILTVFTVIGIIVLLLSLVLACIAVFFAAIIGAILQAVVQS